MLKQRNWKGLWRVARASQTPGAPEGVEPGGLAEVPRECTAVDALFFVVGGSAVSVFATPLGSDGRVPPTRGLRHPAYYPKTPSGSDSAFMFCGCLNVPTFTYLSIC